MKNKKPKNYINNKDFYNAIVEYNAKVKKHIDERRNSEVPGMPDYIGKCFIQIANRLASRPNFSGYSYRDEMIEDGIENCIMAYNSFNPEKYENPFAYFTQIIWFAFLRRIEKEKKQSYIKHMSLVNMSMNMAAEGGHEKVVIDDHKAASYVDKFEKKKTEKKKKVTGLEKFAE